MDGSIIIVSVLILAGVGLLMVELFLLSGSMVSAVLGFFSIGAGVYYSYNEIGERAGFITLLISIFILIFSFFFIIKSKFLRRIGLKAEIKSTVDSKDLLKINVGDIGISESRLNPIGKVNINNIVVEGKSFDGAFIDQKTEIRVVKVESYNILVKRNDTDSYN